MADILISNLLQSSHHTSVHQANNITECKRNQSQITTTAEARMALRDADMMDWELFTDDRTESDAHPVMKLTDEYGTCTEGTSSVHLHKSGGVEDFAAKCCGRATQVRSPWKVKRQLWERLARKGKDRHGGAKGERQRCHPYCGKRVHAWTA